MGALQLQRPDTNDQKPLLRTVLLVDDDADMRLYLRSCLRTLASPFERVIEAPDGLEALRLVRAGDVDLVITDVGLPGIDGRRLSRAIRDDVRLNHVLVLLISGEPTAVDADADGFLNKPFNGLQLSAAVDRLSTRRR